MRRPRLLNSCRNSQVRPRVRLNPAKAPNVERINLLAQKKASRCTDGSMLVLVVISGVIVILLFLVGLSVYMFWGREKLGETRTEFKVLSLAKSLNENDRVGQINNVVARSRELVYLSRVTESKIETDNERCWASLSTLLCDDARNGAEMVELERKYQVTLSKNNVDSMVKQFNLESSEKPLLSGLFWESGQTYIDETNLGWVSNVDSNVFGNDTYSDLREIDQRSNYIQARSNLYRGNIDAKLPPPDNDLYFKFCSLPAPVEDSRAQTRLIKPEHYVKAISLDQIPTAIEIKQHLTVKVSNEQPEDLHLQGFAAAPGAAAPPP